MEEKAAEEEYTPPAPPQPPMPVRPDVVPSDTPASRPGPTPADEVERRYQQLLKEYGIQ